jgi:cytoskeletal protein CcmA (bactofilin family)
MPWRMFDRKQQDSGEWSGFLEKGVRLEGKLESPGTLRIDSHVKGTLASEGTLILGEHSRVDGELSANAVIIAGRFDGLIYARDRVEIQAKAIVTGEIRTPCLIIEPSAIFDGRCIMLATKEPSTLITIPIRSAAAHA